MNGLRVYFHSLRFRTARDTYHAFASAANRPTDSSVEQYSAVLVDYFDLPMLLQAAA